MADFTFDIDLYSDLHKDAYGFRPRNHWFYDEATADEDRQLLWEQAIEDLELRMEEDRRREAAAVEQFEAAVDRYIETGAADRETAIRWMVAAGGWEREYDPGYIVYCLGLPYHKGYEEEFLPHIGKKEVDKQPKECIL